MSSTKIGVRELAEYAADPKAFRKNRGRTMNTAAAKAGIKAHDDLGRGLGFSWRLFFILLIIGLIAYLVY